MQLTDLDGDGVEEAVAFFRSSNDERPLKIYIFRAVEDSYEQAAVIEGSGTAIYSIRYVDMDRDGRREILVGWRISPEIQALGVYSISGYEPTPLMFSLYTRYEVLDFDGDEEYAEPAHILHKTRHRLFGLCQVVHRKRPFELLGVRIADVYAHPDAFAREQIEKVVGKRRCDKRGP